MEPPCGRHVARISAAFWMKDLPLKTAYTPARWLNTPARSLTVHPAPDTRAPGPGGLMFSHACTAAERGLDLGCSVGCTPEGRPWPWGGGPHAVPALRVACGVWRVACVTKPAGQIHVTFFPCPSRGSDPSKCRSPPRQSLVTPNF